MSNSLLSLSEFEIVEELENSASDRLAVGNVSSGLFSAAYRGIHTFGRTKRQPHVIGFLRRGP